MVRLLFDLGLVLSFDHYSGQVLGSRITKQQSPVAVEGIFDLTARLRDRLDAFKWLLFAHLNVDEDLGIPRKAFRHFRERLVSGPHAIENKQARHHSITDEALA